MAISNALAFLLDAEVDDKLDFSLTRRPAPYTYAPWMSLLSGDATGEYMGRRDVATGPMAGTAPK